MGKITDWKLLESGQHVRMNCGYEEFVGWIGATGVDILFTRECTSLHSCEKTYRAGFGPNTYYFQHGAAEPVEALGWWSEVARLRGWPMQPGRN